MAGAGTLVAVCAVAELHEAGRGGLTAIDKRPLPGLVRIESLGVSGDEQRDVAHHGGVDQALYAYAREEAQRWAGELGRPVTPGMFGENLATRGLTVTDAVIGERWRIGPAVVVEVTLPRVPCVTFKTWMGEPRWVKRFSERGDVGSYLRVITAGTIEAGDAIEVLDRPAHGVTVRELFTVEAQDPARLRRLLDESEYLPEKAVRQVRQALASTARSR
jgi:MOSC domain-containing protein YiiM